MRDQPGLKSSVRNQFQNPQVVQQKLLFGGKLISLKNTTQIFKSDQTNQHYFKVQNIFCKKQNQTLLKITNIFFKDRVIKITDEIHPSLKQQIQSFSSKPQICQFQTQKSFQERKCSFIVDTQELTKIKKRRLNKYSKNIVKLFIGWVNSFQNFAIEQEIIKNLLKICQSFNYQLIMRMRERVIIADLFLRFLQTNPVNAINGEKYKSTNQNYLRSILKLKRLMQSTDATEDKPSFDKNENASKSTQLGFDPMQNYPGESFSNNCDKKNKFS